jgi:hypothetical protein
MKLNELIEQLTALAADRPDFLDAEIVAAPMREFPFGGAVDAEDKSNWIAAEYQKLPSPFEQFKVVIAASGLNVENPDAEEKYVVLGFEVEEDVEENFHAQADEFVN